MVLRGFGLSLHTEICALPQLVPILIVVYMLGVGATVVLVDVEEELVDLLGDVAGGLRGVDAADVLLQGVVQSVKRIVDGFLGDYCGCSLIDVIVLDVFLNVVVAPGVRGREVLRESERLRGQEGRLVGENGGRCHGFGGLYI